MCTWALPASIISSTKAEKIEVEFGKHTMFETTLVVLGGLEPGTGFTVIQYY